MKSVEGKVVVMSYDAYIEEQKEIAQKNYDRGRTRGMQHLIFLLNQFRLGNTGRMAVVDDTAAMAAQLGETEKKFWRFLLAECEEEGGRRQEAAAQAIIKGRLS